MLSFCHFSRDFPLFLLQFGDPGAIDCNIAGVGRIDDAIMEAVDLLIELGRFFLETACEQFGLGLSLCPGIIEHHFGEIE